MSSNRHQINMCHGPLFSQLIRFSVPLMLSGWLQLLFVAADMAVVGRYGSSDALAAVGAASYITGLLVNFFCGISLGVNVLVARYFGAGDRKIINRTVHTAIAASLTGGVVLTVLGLLVAKPLLHISNVPAELTGRSFRYIAIYFCGIPFILLYNFCSAILRSVGDTRRPMIFIVIAGIINVLLNLFFVRVCGMHETGVALASVISMLVSAWLCLRVLINARSAIRVKRKSLRIDFGILKEILLIGVPAGVQGAVFSISNLTVQSAINLFGPAVIAGNAAALNIEGMVYNVSYAYHQTVISMVGQTSGGKRYDRLWQGIIYSMVLTVTMTIFCVIFALLFGDDLMHVFTKNQDVVDAGILRLSVLLPFYALCAAMDIVSGSLRGLGHSMLSAVVTTGGVCGVRILWVLILFPLCPDMAWLLVCYPVSWLLTSGANAVFLRSYLWQMFRNASSDAVLPKTVLGRKVRQHH